MKKSSLTTILFAGGLSLLAAPGAFANEGLAKFRQMDANGDGRLTDTERSEYAVRHFQECDRNNDGQVTLAELSTPSRQGRGMSEQAAAAHLSEVDGDGNGVITRAESESYADNSFSSADRNKDGILHPHEFQAAHQTRQQRIGN